jgi:DNA-binding CsgD family transcriptional regulator/tetratricopeptide (TPR) repeat protein
VKFTGAGPLEQGRHAFQQQRWREAYAQLSDADRQASLEAEDLERLAMSAHLLGRDTDSAELLARAHQAFLGQGQTTRAARCAFWLAMTLLSKGERARGAGWIARAQRLLDEGTLDCAERGYLLLPLGRQLVGEGRFAEAHAAFEEAAAIGERFGDRDLVSLARQGRGRALIRLGDTAEGVALLDEVMVAVTAGELSPPIAGVVYCSVISACVELFDIRRAQEWTDALSAWCAAQPELVAYRGECLVHRAEIMRLHGVWPDALDEAQRACVCLSEPPGQMGAGAAFYQLAELHRLRGEIEQAEAAYRHASELGRAPQPGLGLLRLAQGRIDLAKAAICRMLDEIQEPRARSTMLAACVDIMLAVPEVSLARQAADQLSAIASDPRIDTPFLRAIAAQATGAVLLAEGDAKAALASLRVAWNIWRDLSVPYEAARSSVLIGLACRALGDLDGGKLELDAARRTFQQLGAAPELARVQALDVSDIRDASDDTLTVREVQVLKLIASGKTNRAIADTLGISEKTVARHVSNIFIKLDLSSRAAATAYAFQHHLV